MELIFSDFSSIEGSCCYCSEEAGNEIRTLISPLPLKAVHYIGTGDFHYQTLFWLERVTGPFSLLLLDNHPDDQPGAFGEKLLSCGSWVREAKKLPLLQNFTWLRRASDYSASALTDAFPLYISVDLDILSPEFARTDWDQGDMSISALNRILCDIVFRFSRPRYGKGIIGVDICGGITETKGGRDVDMELNRAAILGIAGIFRDC